MAVVASAARASADSRARESVADEGDGGEDDDGGVHAGGRVKRRMSEARGEARAATATSAAAAAERTTKRSESERESDGDGPGDVRWTPTLVGDLRASRRLTREELTRELGDDRDGSKARGSATSSASTKEMLASRNDVWGLSLIHI